MLETGEDQCGLFLTETLAKRGYARQPGTAGFRISSRPAAPENGGSIDHQRCRAARRTAASAGRSSSRGASALGRRTPCPLAGWRSSRRRSGRSPRRPGACSGSSPRPRANTRRRTRRPRSSFTGDGHCGPMLAIGIAQIQACAAWTPRDCFCSRARSARAIATPGKHSPAWRSAAPSLIGHSLVASTAAGRGPRFLALCGGPAKDQPVPAVVRCRERQQDVAPEL
jgi:hypothetical protein